MTTRPTLVGAVPAIAQVRAAIARVRASGATYAHAVARETELQRDKAERKRAGILRLMQAENPCIPGKLHTATAAEAIVEADGEYREFLRRLSLATVQVILTRTECTAARIEAQLELSLILVEPDDDDHDDAREPAFT